MSITWNAPVAPRDASASSPAPAPSPAVIAPAPSQPPRPVAAVPLLRQPRAQRILLPVLVGLVLIGAWQALVPGRSFPSRQPLAPLDRIALSREWQCESHGVHHSALATFASDHLPIWAEISAG